MGQEFFINSEELEAKVRSLLPSQGGAGAGVDLSASTQIIPIIDLTESAEGSNLRQDLQTSLSFKSGTPFSVTNTTTTVVTTTGYFRLVATRQVATATTSYNRIILNDGTTDKVLYNHQSINTTSLGFSTLDLDLNFFLSAGDSLIVESFSTNSTINGSTRQIASIDGTLTDP